MPKVSVIIPVYNAEQYLEECLDSVLYQTFTDMEIICIDDCSTDHSRDILWRYAEKDGRITLLYNQVNRGLAYTRNKGMDQASGAYVLFVDSDDYIEEDLLEKVLDKASGNDIVCYDYRRLDHIYRGRDCHTYSMVDGVYSGWEYLSKAVKSGSIIYSTWSKIYNRDFLISNGIRFPDGHLYEDIFFCFRCLTRAERIYSFHDKLYVYRIHQDSIMTKALTIKNVEDYFWNVCELTKNYLGFSCEGEAAQAVEEYIRMVCRDFIRVRRKYERSSRDETETEQWSDQRYYRLYRIFSGLAVRTGSLGDFTLEQLKAVSHKKLIVYGAGDIAREVIELLDQNDLAIYGVAVSPGKADRKSLLGNRVLTIDRYLDVKEESLVILGTNPRTYGEIEEELEKYGFSQYMEIM